MPSTSSTASTYLLHKGTFEDGTGKWYGVQLTGGVLTFAIDDGSTKTNVDLRVTTNGYNLFNGQWQHIVAVRDKETNLLKIYLNGTGATKANSTTGTIGKGDALLLGNSAENKPYKDQMDDVRLYNYALTDAEIAALAAGTPLVAKATNPTPAHQAAGVAAGNVALGWTGSAQTYNVLVGTSANSMTTRATGLASPAYTATGLDELTTYFWRVDAVRDGETATGDVWSFSVVDLTPPTVLTKNITVTLANGTATIKPIDVNNGSYDAHSEVLSLSLDKTTFDCSNIGSNQVMLTAEDAAGNIASAPATVTVIGAVPNPTITVSRTDNTTTGTDANTIVLGYGAQALTLTAAGGTGTTFSWTPAAGLSNATVANPVFVPTAAGTYTFSVTATNQYGCSASQDVAITVIEARSGHNGDKVLVCHSGNAISIAKSAVPAHLAHGCSLGACQVASRSSQGATAGAGSKADAFSKEVVFEVYPTSVADGTLHYALSGADNGQVEVLTLTGQRVKTETATATAEGTISVAGLRAGTYMVRVVTARGSYTKRFVIP
jgi:PKD repeat protein